MGKLSGIYLYEKLSVVNKKRAIQPKPLTDFKPIFLFYAPEKIKGRRFCEASQGLPKVNISVKLVTEHSTEELESASKTIEMTTLGQGYLIFCSVFQERMTCDLINHRTQVNSFSEKPLIFCLVSSFYTWSMYSHNCEKVKMMGKVWFYAFLLYFESFSGGCELCEFADFEF